MKHTLGICLDHFLIGCKSCDENLKGGKKINIFTFTINKHFTKEEEKQQQQHE